MFELVSVSVFNSIFVTLLFVGFGNVSHMLLGHEISYSKLSKTVPLGILSPSVFDK